MFVEQQRLLISDLKWRGLLNNGVKAWGFHGQSKPHYLIVPQPLYTTTDRTVHSKVELKLSD